MTLRTIHVSLLGKLTLYINGKEIVLPKSRKARALFAYLVFSQKPINRVWLAEFLFAETSDPKGNLRWCLSRLKATFDKIDEELICSDSFQIWTTVPEQAVDFHQLMAMRARESFGLKEHDLLEKTICGVFLPHLTLTKMSDFETWRMTTQSNLASTLEEILDLAVTTNLGANNAIRFATLFVNAAPDLERAWFLLITAFIRVNRISNAKEVLRTARVQLIHNGGLQLGLLKQIETELEGVNSSVKSSTTTSNPKKTSFKRPTLDNASFDRPSVYIEAFSGSSGSLFSEVESVFLNIAALSKSFVLMFPQDMPEPANLKGVDFVLSPSISRVNDIQQVDIKVTDGSSGHYLDHWQIALKPPIIEPLRRTLIERFELDLQMAMSMRALQKPIADLTAMDYYYLALPKIHGPAVYSADEAMGLINKSLELNPNLGPALSAQAWVRRTHQQYNQTDEARAEAASIARRAIEHAYGDACTMGFAAMSIAHLEANARAGLNFAKRALDLNPYSPTATLAVALMHHYCGMYSLSLEYLERLSASHIEPLCFLADACYALNYYQLNQLEEAIERGRSAVDRHPGLVPSLRVLVASLARSGQVAEAQALATNIIKLDPSEHLQYFNKYSMYTDAAARDRLHEDLVLAGLPYSP